MKIMINGMTELTKVESLMKEIITNMSERIGVPADTEMKIEGVEFKVVFNIDGVNTYASVPRDVQGETVHEIFTVAVHLDDNGEIIQEEDNEDESFYDGYTMAQSIKKDYQYEGIISGYQNDQLEYVNHFESDESDDKKVMRVIYNLKGEQGTQVVRYFKGDVLVFEETLKDK